MSEADQDAWLEHLKRAYARDELTTQEHESDVADVLVGIPPRNFLATVEDKEPVYSDSRVPYDWIDVRVYR